MAISRSPTVTYLYLALYVFLSTGVILYNKVFIYSLYSPSCGCHSILVFVHTVDNVTKVVWFSISYYSDDDSHGFLISASNSPYSRHEGKAPLASLSAMNFLNVFHFSDFSTCNHGK